MTSYPTESAKEMGNRFKDLPTLPQYITRKGPYIGSEFVKLAMETADCPIAFDDLKVTLEKKFGVKEVLGTHSY